MGMPGGGGGALRELFAYFEVEVETDKIAKFENTLKGTVAKVRAAGYAIVEALALKEIGEFFEKQIEAAAHVQDLSEKLDVGAGFLRNFGFAAQEVGVDFESATMALGFLNRNIGEAITKGGESAKAFARMKVPLKDSAGRTREMADVLFDVSDAMAKMPDQAHRAAAAQEVFGREGKALLPVLAKGRGALEAYMREAEELSSGLGDKFYADAKKARSELEKFRFGLDSLKQRLTAAILPLVTRWGERMVKIIKDLIQFTKHTNVLKTAMIFLTGVIGTGAVIALFKLLRAMGILKGTIKESIVAFLEFAAPLAILWFLYGAFDDLYTFMTGGQSVIGDTIDKMYGVGASAKFVEQVKDAWKSFTGVLGDLVPSLDTIKELFVSGLPTAIKLTARLLVEIAREFDRVVSAGEQLGLVLDHIKNVVHDLPGKVFGDLFGMGGNASDSDNDHFSEKYDKISHDFNERKMKLDALSDVLNGLKAPTGYNAPPGQQPLGGVDPTGRFSVVAPPSGDTQPGQSVAQQARNAGRTVNVTNNITQHLHVASGDPRSVAKAAGQGPATETEKAMHHALASQGGS